MPHNKAIKALEIYKKSRPKIINWSLKKISAEIVESDWYCDHKGEVVLKISINISKSPFSVEVLQKIPYLFLLSKKKSDTEWAIRTKKAIIQILEED